MKIGEFQEQNDGSAIVELEMTQEEQEILISYAVNDILRKQLDLMKDVETNEGDV
mgnify:CR=1 FL=1